MMDKAKPSCCYCGLHENDIDQRDGDPAELRPYGPKGAWLCFNCMKSSPEREASAKDAFVAQLDACGSVAVVDGTNVGPYPLSEPVVSERD
jgi:hypothetical protein